MKTKSIAIIAALALTACSAGPDYQPPQINLPTNWQATQTATNKLLEIKQEQLQTWWTTFNDPELNQLMTKLFDANLDLKIAFARIAQARAEQHAAHAQELPSLAVDTGVQRNQNPFPGFAPGLRYNQFQLGFDASWELDLAGGLQRKAEAASAELAANQEQYRQAMLMLSAELARTYIDYRHTQQLLKIRQTYLTAQQQSLALTEKLFAQGVATRTEVLNFTAQTQQIAASIPDLTAQLANLLSRLEILTAQSPGTLYAELLALTDIPEVQGREILLSPTETLRQRPDIRVMERHLAAATALQGAAMAELYPKLSISTFLGLRNTDLESLFKSASFSYSTAGSLIQPLLNFGKIKAGINLAEARQQEAYQNYEKTVLAALHETETALTGYLQEEVRRLALQNSVTDLSKALHLAERRFSQGIDSRLEVLSAERELCNAEAALSESMAKSASDLIAVYKALGGSG